MESFSYLPLLNATQIRLIAFESNPTGGNANSLSLSCRLLVYDIEDAPPFVTLSYTWGPARQADTDEQMTHGNKILMNGLVFEVSLNLRNALDSIQMRCLPAADSEPKLFWVDAICINQHDLKERTAQVTIMGKIYSKAARVWIWPGLAREINMEKVVVLIGKLSKASHDIQTKRGANQSSSNTNWDIVTDQGKILKKYKPPPWRNPVWVDLALLFERNWWTRMWIVQEIALAANAEMMCGNYSIPWNQVRLCSHLLVAGLDAQLGHQLQTRRETEKTITHVGAGLMTLDRICQMIDSPNKNNGLANINAYFTGKPKLGSAAGALCVLLHLCRGRSASVPKDQVYALLGLLPVMLQFSTLRKEHAEIILADYEKSDCDVFIQTARWIIEQTQWLGYLTLIEDHGFERDLSLPTWVADMTKLPPTRLDICNELAKSVSIWPGYVSKKTESMIPKIVDNILHSAGTRLGTIARISEPLDDMCNGKSTFEEGASIMLDIPRKYTYTKEPREDVLWKVLSGEESTETSLKIPFGQFWLRKLIENVSGSNLTLEKFLETIPSIDVLGRSVPDVSLPSHNQIRDAFASSYVKSEFRKLRENLAYESGGFEGIFRKLAVSRRFFRTERNHLGLCHSSTRPGDEVWCLVRAPTPFIFRKTGDTKNFKLVGPAYIYGFINSILPTLEVENSDIRIE